MNDKTLDNVDNVDEFQIPSYVEELRNRYKCSSCKFCERNSSRFYATCAGYPEKRTDCTKWRWLISFIRYIATPIVVVTASFYLFSFFNNIYVSFVYTILFAFVLDLFCLSLERGVHEVFKRIEKSRRKKYDKKVAKLENINYRNNKKEEQK